MKNFKFATLAAVLLASTALVGVARAEVPTEFINAQTGTTYTVIQSDCGKLVTFSNAASVAVTLPQAGTAGKFFAGCWIEFASKGLGTVTITPTTSTIGAQTSVALTTNRSLKIVSDSTNYQIVPGSGISGGVSTCSSSPTAFECDGLIGKVTTGTLAMAGGVSTTLIFTNNFVQGSGNQVLCEIATYSSVLSTAGIPAVVTCGAITKGIAVGISNVSTTALTGVVVINFAVIS